MNSMTGFGVARGKVGSVPIVVETRSVNHRFCEVNLRFPGRWASLEPEVVRRVRQNFARGKIELFLREESRDQGEQEIELVRKAHRLLRRIQRELSLKGEPSLTDLLTFRGVLFSQRPHQEGVESESLRHSLLKLVEGALAGVQKMRGREGTTLQKWFLQRLKMLRRLLSSIEKNSLRRGPDYRRRLEGRLQGMGKMDEERLVQEAAMMAGRADVTEEIVRLRSHLKECGRFLHLKETIGRKLDFLAQEMGREINTIGSKVQGVRIAHQVIEFKAELERIREQVQNVE